LTPGAASPGDNRPGEKQYHYCKRFLQALTQIRQKMLLYRGKLLSFAEHCGQILRPSFLAEMDGTTRTQEGTIP